ncbi:MAG: ThiF family adenylyltransferase [Anaerolineae bacterium]|nr:ThiF family adenylyltransferase [Anaerolineae bacterium]
MTDNHDQNQWDRVARYMGQDALTQLASKSVAVVGLGSGGGFVALSLAMSGVGRFVLIDNDDLEAPNVVRHVADLRYVGKSKVAALAELIHLRNPNAKVETVMGRIEDQTEALHGVDLVIVGVDGEQSKYAINGVCRDHNLTAIYAGVYERGEGGDVVIVYPTGKGPCYACWADQLRDDIHDTPDGQIELDYGMIGPDGTIAAEPGLWLHVVRVASVQGDMALNEMLRGTAVYRDNPANTVILANVPLEVMEGLVIPPYSAQWVNVPRDPHCMVCGDANRATEALSLNELMGDAATDDEQEQLDDTLTNTQR